MHGIGIFLQSVLPQKTYAVHLLPPITLGNFWTKDRIQYEIDMNREGLLNLRHGVDEGLAHAEALVQWLERRVLPVQAGMA